MIRLAAVLFVAVLLPGCAGSIDGVPLTRKGEPLQPGDPKFATHLQAHYLGAGGLLLKRGNDAILIAPFFSNPSIARVAFLTLKPDEAQIDRFLRPLAATLRDVDAILIGHAHYDHLLDVPYARGKYLPNAKIYGSNTMKHTLYAVRGEIPQSEVVSLDRDTGAVDRMGKWNPVANGRIRFMALDSEHAAVFLHVHFSHGEYTEPLEALPQRATDWRDGRNLAFVIDFLAADGATVDFRVHYQDAASTAPLGFEPAIDGHRVDVAFLCLPGFDQVPAYPEAIVKRTQPRYVVGIHWENFFVKIPEPPEDPEPVPSLDGKGFVARLYTALPPDAEFKLPVPTAWMTFAPAR